MSNLIEAGLDLNYYEIGITCLQPRNQLEGVHSEGKEGFRLGKGVCGEGVSRDEDKVKSSHF